MKKLITSYLLKFALVATVLAIVFRLVLRYGIDNQSNVIIISSAVLYFIGMFIAGWHFGKKDGNYLPIFDVGFRFHFTTYLIFSVISELWFILGFNANGENVKTVHLTVIIWGFFVLMHFILFLIMRKKSIDGLDKQELFE